MNQTDTGKRYAQKTAFYLVNELKPRLERNGITTDNFWTFVKVEHGVSSRKDLTELDWVKLAARLLSARKHQTLFEELVDVIKTHQICKELKE